MPGLRGGSSLKPSRRVEDPGPSRTDMIERRETSSRTKEVEMAEISGKSAPGAAALRDQFGIDEGAASTLLDAALSGGGDYAELFFEHRVGGGITYENQAVKSANRGV